MSGVEAKLISEGSSSKQKKLFDSLEISAGDVLFVHASMDWLRGGIKEALELIEALTLRLGPTGTLLMPSYTWRGGIGRPNPGSVFDVRHAPSQVGLLSEVFRRSTGTYRSEQYWVPVCGRGRFVHQLLEGQAEIVHPFEPGSTFARLLEYNTKVVGLGVSLNTSSLAHLPDYELEDEYPFKVFSDAPITGDVINHEGRLIKTETYIVKPEVMAHYKPGNLFGLSPLLQRDLRRDDVGQVIRFSYPLSTYYSEAMRLGRDALSKALLPPWFNNE